MLDRVSIDAADQPVEALACATSIVRSSIRSHGTGSINSALSSMSIDQTLVDGGSGISSGSSDVRITNSVITNQSFDALQSYGFRLHVRVLCTTSVVSTAKSAYLLSCLLPDRVRIPLRPRARGVSFA